MNLLNNIQISGPTNIIKIKKSNYELIMFSDFHIGGNLICKGKSYKIEDLFDLFVTDVYIYYLYFKSIFYLVFTTFIKLVKNNFIII